MPPTAHSQFELRLLSRIANLFWTSPPPIKRLRRIADEYDDRSGETDTLQGALANAIVMVRLMAVS